LFVAGRYEFWQDADDSIIGYPRDIVQQLELQQQEHQTGASTATQGQEMSVVGAEAEIQVLLIDIVTDQGGIDGSSGSGADGVASGGALVRKATLLLDLVEDQHGIATDVASQEQEHGHTKESNGKGRQDGIEEGRVGGVRSLKLARAVNAALNRKDRGDMFLVNLLHPAPANRLQSAVQRYQSKNSTHYH
jgi:hypothetical protein